jgi:lysophospholipase L1-like esterase
MDATPPSPRTTDASVAPVEEFDAAADGEADASAPVNVGLDSFRLTVIGSSTSAGEGASSSRQGWVALLAAELDRRLKTPFDVRNLSVGGYASGDLLPGSGRDGNVDDAIQTEPDLIVVALAGSNDLSSGTSESEFSSRLGEIREAARSAGIPTFFLTTAPKDLAEDERRALGGWAQTIVEDFDTCWVPIRSEPYAPCVIEVFEALANDSLAIASEYGAGDGIHLNDEGHAAIFAQAEAVVVPYACQATPCD